VSKVRHALVCINYEKNISMSPKEESDYPGQNQHGTYEQQNLQTHDHHK